MKKIDNVKCNKIIAEFMGDGHEACNIQGADFLVHKESSICDDDYLRAPYTESLDALVPVWEKLGICGLKVDTDVRGPFQKRRWRVRVMKGETLRVRKSDESFQQAAAHATALAIKELGAI